MRSPIAYQPNANADAYIAHLRDAKVSQLYGLVRVLASSL